MHMIITDSGVGGLSVCAAIERFLRTQAIEDPVRLTYVNAAPENDFGYNAMGSRGEKLAYFDRFLQIIAGRYSPDLIYIACNTLSVLYADTRFSKTGSVRVRGIVETGATRLLHALQESPEAAAVIFGTATTIEEGTYSRFLQNHGVQAGRIIPQACPSLADTISEDREGAKARQAIEKYVAAAIGTTAQKASSYLVYLACTHYGYRKGYFRRAFEGRGLEVSVLNPNELVVDDLFGKDRPKRLETQGAQRVDVEFITRYKIPETTLETIAFFLEAVSPKTVQRLMNYTYEPDLF